MVASSLQVPQHQSVEGQGAGFAEEALEQPQRHDAHLVRYVVAPLKQPRQQFAAVLVFYKLFKKIRFCVLKLHFAHRYVKISEKLLDKHPFQIFSLNFVHKLKKHYSTHLKLITFKKINNK